MTDPLMPQEPGSTERIMVDGHSPVENPTTLRSMMLTTNTGIALFGAAAIWFCLRLLHQAFLLAMLIIIALAIGNIVLLSLEWRRSSYAFAVKAGGSALPIAMIAATAAAAATAAVAAASSSSVASLRNQEADAEPARPRRPAAAG